VHPSRLLVTRDASQFTAGTDLFISLFNNLAIFLVIVYGFLSRRLKSYRPFARQASGRIGETTIQEMVRIYRIG
jgi:hypothetical protein